jgi:hypothetical protein
MAKKQVKLTETPAAVALPVKSQPVKAKAPRITAAKHKAAVVESPAPQEVEVTHEAIASVAYGYWESRGYQGGDALDDWFRAEAELKSTSIN